MKLENKVCIVTGASSGIGKEVAIAYAKEGAKVVACARRLEKLEELVKISEDLPGEINAMAVDVSEQADIDHMVDATIKKYGRVDVLVNNAGILDSYKSAVAITDDIWKKMFEVNVDSVMRTSRKVLPLMRKQKSGVILNTSSVGGLNGMRGGLAYVATKHAVVGMTKNIGYSYAEEGIRCVGIAPGSVETEIGQKVKDPDMEVLSKLMKGFESFPSKTSPEELAKVYVFLASEDANFINGTTIVVDGGWTAF